MFLSSLATYVWSFVDVYTIAVLVTVYWVTRYFLWHGVFSRKNLAPGFFGFPLVGAVPYFIFGREPVFQKLEAVSKERGPVVRYRFGNETIVVVVGAKAVREGMLNDDLLGRPKSGIDDGDLDALFTKKSILNIGGDLWKKHRRFALSTLRDLGFGKTPVMEQRIQEEIRSLIGIIDKENGHALDIQPALVEATGNNISSLVFGGKLETGSERTKQIPQLMSAITRENEKLIKFAFIPFALKIMSKLQLGVAERMKCISKKFVSFLSESVDSHKEDLDRDNPRDYVDHYLIAQGEDGDFTTELARGNAMALFVAGSSTVRVTVEYLIHLMAEYPEVQRKVQVEIDEVTGRSRDVTWTDSKELVYTCAVIAERHRYFTVAPLGVGRKVLRPTKLCGYDLEVNNQVMFSIDSVHYDPEVFVNPREFRPERFIDEDGKLVNTEKVWAFSIGKRACPGESLAVLEVFLYFTALLQNYTIEADGPVRFRPLRCLFAETLPQKVRFNRRA